MAPPQLPSPAATTPGSGAGTLPANEWMIPQVTRNKYNNTFKERGGDRTGFIAGDHARLILLQNSANLPANILAHIWSLSDVDKDGQWTNEEFILAGEYLQLISRQSRMMFFRQNGEVYKEL